MNRIACIFVAAACGLAVACGNPRKDHQEPGSPDPGEQPAADEAAGDEGPDRTGEMLAHFVRVTVSREAIVAGDLATVREQAGWLAEHGGPSPRPPSWEAHVAALRAAAEEAYNADGVAEAAAATSRMGGACGGCHAAVGVNVPYADTEAPSEPDGDLQAAMRAHQWASDQLWLGLVIPSDRAWTRGAAALADALLHPRELSGEGPIDPQMVALIESARSLAGEAAAATARAERERIYGALLATCAGCHDKYAATRPTPARAKHPLRRAPSPP